MKKLHKYKPKPVNAAGRRVYTDIENQTWHQLITRQKKHIQKRACAEFISGVEQLNLPQSHVPDICDLSEVLEQTHWRLKAVEGTVTETEFFKLLAQRHFPVATFIRIPQQLDYLQQPDIFHEIFGHCPLLLHPPYADFVSWYGQFALQASPMARIILCRLFWFTIEFGLMQTVDGLRIYGGGILSSYQETTSSLDPSQSEHRPFDIESMLNQSYDYTCIQPVYYTLSSWDDLYSIMNREREVLAMVESITGSDQEPFNIC